jgi:hypothetical protein
MTASTLGSPIRLIDRHSGYPFNAGQLEDDHRDLKCRKTRTQRLRIQKPEALMLQSIPPYVDTPIFCRMRWSLRFSLLIVVAYNALRHAELQD